jgi:RHS repeat-associated protein
VLLSTSWYYYSAAGNVTRIVTKPEASADYSAARFEYALNGETVTYVAGEQWTDAAVCPPTGYEITYAREFRYDEAHARYLSRERDPAVLLGGTLTVVSDTWSDYDGDPIYGDFTVSGGNPTNTASSQPGSWSKQGGVDGYLHNDHLGTLRNVSTAAGASSIARVFTAFGERILGPSDRFGYVGSSGYESHADFPYLHVGARYYDPSSGRFLQRDPIGIHGGLNVYVYVNSIPSSRVDPDGLSFLWLGWGAAGPMAGCGSLLFLVVDRIIVPAIDKWADDNYEEGMQEINNPPPPAPPPPPSPPKPICVRGCHNDNQPWG